MRSDLLTHSDALPAEPSSVEKPLAEAPLARRLLQRYAFAPGVVRPLGQSSARGRLPLSVVWSGRPIEAVSSWGEMPVTSPGLAARRLSASPAFASPARPQSPSGRRSPKTPVRQLRRAASKPVDPPPEQGLDSPKPGTALPRQSVELQRPIRRSVRGGRRPASVVANAPERPPRAVRGASAVVQRQVAPSTSASGAVAPPRAVAPMAASPMAASPIVASPSVAPPSVAPPSVAPQIIASPTRLDVSGSRARPSRHARTPGTGDAAASPSRRLPAAKAASPTGVPLARHAGAVLVIQRQARGRAESFFPHRTLPSTSQGPSGPSAGGIFPAPPKPLALGSGRPAAQPLPLALPVRISAPAQQQQSPAVVQRQLDSTPATSTPWTSTDRDDARRDVTGLEAADRPTNLDDSAHGVDEEALTERVLGRFLRRLAVEGERRGWRS